MYPGFPLLEVEAGERWRFTLEREPIDVATYIKAQGRFKHLNDEQIAAIEHNVSLRCAALQQCVRNGFGAA